MPKVATRLLRVDEVAEMLNLKPDTIRVWLLRKKLPTVRIGRTVRVPLEAVEDLIQRSTTAPRVVQRAERRAAASP